MVYIENFLFVFLNDKKFMFLIEKLNFFYYENETFRIGRDCQIE